MNYNILENYKKQLAVIEKTVGTQWLEHWVHNMRDDYGRAYDASPPLAVAWLKANDELAMAELTGGFTPAESTLRLIRLAADLNNLQHITGFSKILDRLKGNVDDFSTACYQLSIANGYLNYSEHITLNNGDNCPDIIVHFSAGDLGVVTLAPVIDSTAEILPIAAVKLAEGIAKLNNQQGIVYLDLPLPLKDTPLQFLEAVTAKLHNKLKLPENCYLIVTTAFVQMHQLKRAFNPVKVPTGIDVYYPLW